MDGWDGMEIVPLLRALLCGANNVNIYKEGVLLPSNLFGPEVGIYQNVGLQHNYVFIMESCHTGGSPSHHHEH